MFSRSSGNVWVVAFLIVYRFRDNRQKHQHRRLKFYRGDNHWKLYYSSMIIWQLQSRTTGSSEFTSTSIVSLRA